MKIHLKNDYFELANIYHNNCIDCGQCIKCCPIINKEARRPKKFLEDLKKPSEEEFVDSISCLNCGYCKAVCPKSVDIGELLFELKKVNVRFRKDRKYQKKYRVIKSHQKNSFRELLINATKSKRVFFPGCSLSASNPTLVKEVSKLLRTNDIGLFSGCCASPSSVSGDIDMFNENKEKIRLKFQRAGVEEVIVACSNCYMAFKDIDTIKVTSIYKTLEEGNYILDKSIDSTYKDYMLHDPCPTRFEADIHESVRILLNKCGVEFDEFEYNKKNTACCGDGSMVSVLNTEISKKQLRKRVDEAKESNIISYCQSCVNNFKSQDNGSKHILEFLFEDDTSKKRDTNTIEKWINRYRISKYIDELKKI